MKNFIKNNIIAAVTALIILVGIGGVAVYSAQGSDNMKVIYDQEGNIKNIIPENQQTEEATVEITKEQFNNIETKGRANFTVKNGEVTELTQPKPKDKYMVQYDPNSGELIGAPVENTGNATGNYVELADKEYDEIKQGAKYKIVNGKLAKVLQNVDYSKSTTMQRNPDGSWPVPSTNGNGQSK